MRFWERKPSVWGAEEAVSRQIDSRRRDYFIIVDEKVNINIIGDKSDSGMDFYGEDGSFSFDQILKNYVIMDVIPKSKLIMIN